jgi:GrpB-like predicted nucleotidyltransferase (UPF0157 family)
MRRWAGAGIGERPWSHPELRGLMHSGDPHAPARRRATTRHGPPINLHCRIAGSPNERLALLFRDWFRAHPLAVTAYAQFKQELAAAVLDLEVYTDVKDPVVDLVIVVAEDWAEATGWSP